MPTARALRPLLLFVAMFPFTAALAQAPVAKDRKSVV